MKRASYRHAITGETTQMSADVDRQLVDQLIDLNLAVANELHLKAIQLTERYTSTDEEAQELAQFLRQQAARLRGDA